MDGKSTPRFRGIPILGCGYALERLQESNSLEFTRAISSTSSFNSWTVTRFIEAIDIAPATFWL
jgi:hypothetical protein